MKFWVRFLFLIILLVFCSTSGEEVNAPAEVAKSFYTELLEGDIEKAIEMIEPNDIDADKLPGLRAPIKMIFTSIRSKLEEAGGIASIDTKQITYNADKTEANVSVAITLNNPLNGVKTRTEHIALTKYRWKLEDKRL